MAGGLCNFIASQDQEAKILRRERTLNATRIIPIDLQLLHEPVHNVQQHMDRDAIAIVKFRLHRNPTYNLGRRLI